MIIEILFQVGSVSQTLQNNPQNVKMCEMTHFKAIKSLTGGHFFLVKDYFFKALYFDWTLNTCLGPVLQKVHFASQVRHLRDGFNEK